MIRSSHGPRRRRLIAAAIAALIPVLAGCQAGNNAPTTQWHQPTAGAGIQLGDIAIRNVFVLGAPLGQVLRAGQAAPVYFAVVNGTSPDRLLSISAPGAANSVTLPGGTIRLADTPAVFLTGPAPKVILNRLTRPLTGSAFVRLIMTFQNAGSVSLFAPVIPRADYYATLLPAPTVTPVVRRTGRLTHGGSPTPTAGSPTATPTPTSTTPSPSATP